MLEQARSCVALDVVRLHAWKAAEAGEGDEVDEVDEADEAGQPGGAGEDRHFIRRHSGPGQLAS